ncbi:MAG: molecular chaperone TorD family protein [Bacteroidales bacterium]|nr:molecular chaperone TorD family protein [Bacteroidales bacterium]
MTPKSGLPHLCDAGLLRNLPVESRNNTYGQASRLLNHPVPTSGDVIYTVENNYGALLSVISTAEAYPAASQWRNSGTTTQEHHSHLDMIYKRYGYSRAADDGLEPEDHLGIELLFANLLIEKS